MNHSSGEGGLPDFVAQDRPIAGADNVLWQVFGLHHPGLIKDFPVQPCIQAGFKLALSGFFDRNPGIALAPAVNGARCCSRASSQRCQPAGRGQSVDNVRMQSSLGRPGAS